MEYISTRGSAPALTFEEVLVTGLARDGGLYVPEEVPSFSAAKIAALSGLSYEDLAFEIMYPFMEGSIKEAALKRIIAESYSTFWHKAIAPLVQLGNQEFLLSLYYGPTLAFKDFALQLLGRLIDHFLEKRKEKAVVLGATSGDTGSAAIYGCKASSRVAMFILHPYGKVSDIQRKQMTTVKEPHIFNLAVEGNFDDCQDIVKALFMGNGFLPSHTRLIAVNSINWARIMAQIVYYFYAALHLGAPAQSVAFSVPTGNFGDIYAGYMAKKMGLPIEKLIIATNENAILHHFLKKNRYSRGKVVATLAPSMDIQVSSNFERLLFDLYHQDGASIAALMETFKEKGGISIPEVYRDQMMGLFGSYSCSDEDICHTMAAIYKETGQVIDPHTATAVAAARACLPYKTAPVVILATAHPAKFPLASERAGVPRVQLPLQCAEIMDAEERWHKISASSEAVKNFIVTHTGF